MANREIAKYMASIGRRGGRKSRRALSPEQARTMVRVREARKAFREFHATCFWSSPPDLKIQGNDLTWVVNQLRKHGGRAGWDRAEKLCR